MSLGPVRLELLPLALVLGHAVSAPRLELNLPGQSRLQQVLELETKVKQRFAKISQSKICEDFTITGTVTTRAFSWLKVPTSAFTFKTLLRHYAKQELTHSK